MFQRRFLKPLLIAVSVYVGALVLGGLVGRSYLRRDIEEYLATAQRDVEDSYEDAMDASLACFAGATTELVGSAQTVDRKLLLNACRLRRLDEINIADSNGVWVASTEEKGIVGSRINRSPLTDVYFQILTNDEPIICQSFRPSVEHPESFRKYIAVPFADGSGLLQVGYDQRRVANDFETAYHRFLEKKSRTTDRFYLALSQDGRILASGFPTEAETAQEVGLDPATFPADRNQTFRATVFGISCWCRTSVFAGIRFVTLVADSAYDDMRLSWLLAQHGVLFFVFCVLGVIYVNGEKRRKAAEQVRTAEEARHREDLAMAKTIQHSALPAVFPPYPRDLTVDLFAQMDPARDVGGDFYDFHYVGRERLAVLVADVSGKGVPAAMFMMKAKAVLHDLTTSVTDLGEAVSRANDILCEGNDADMFVTCWIGVLDETSGVLRYVNAGHNPPYLLEAKTQTLRPLTQISGMFLGGMADQRYRAFEVKMAPDDLLFLYTDGVTEANNTLGQMFGETRLEEVLRGERGLGLARFAPEAAALSSPETICRRVRGAVDGFAGKAAQFDDITLLALRYRGLPTVARLTVPVALASVPVLNAFAEERLNAEKCPIAARSDLLVALDEVANNIASYSGGTKMTLEIEVARTPSVIRFRLIDDGQPWNPLDHLDPDITLSADDRNIGGLGILMVKKLMDDVSYVRRRDGNVFAFRKMI